jgi:hypothetical protein
MNPKSLLAQLCFETCDACRNEAMNEMCATKFLKGSLLLVAAALLLVLSGTDAQVPSPDEGADGVYEGRGEGAAGTHATPAADEGADGIFEGNGEGAAAGMHHTLPACICFNFCITAFGPKG